MLMLGMPLQILPSRAVRGAHGVRQGLPCARLCIAAATRRQAGAPLNSTAGPALANVGCRSLGR